MKQIPIKIPVALRSAAAIIFLLCFISGALAQSNAPETDMEDQLKGRIWHAVTERFWKDEAGGLNIEGKGAKEFYEILKANKSKDLSKLREFVQQVKNDASQQSKKPIKPTQLQELVLARLIRNGITNQNSLEYQGLEREITSVFSSTDKDKSESLTPSSIPVTPGKSESVRAENTQESSDDSNAVPPSHTNTLEGYSVLISIISFAIGALLGWLLCKAKVQHDHKHSSKSSEKEIKNLKKQVEELMNKEKTPIISNPKNIVANPNNSTLDEKVESITRERDVALQLVQELRSSHNSTIAPAPISSPAPPRENSIVRFAPVLENNRIPENQITADSMPHLPIMITIKGSNNNIAEYTLNPQVNQARIIGNGLNQLREFFDFTLPPGNFSTIRSAGSGTLEKTTEGWAVRTLAKLHVS